jgi:hypothetical protein
MGFFHINCPNITYITNLNSFQRKVWPKEKVNLIVNWAKHNRGEVAWLGVTLVNQGESVILEASVDK